MSRSKAANLRQVAAPKFKIGAVVLDTDIFALVGGEMLRQQFPGASKFVVSVQVQGAATSLKVKVKERGAANEFVSVHPDAAPLPQGRVKRLEFFTDSNFEYNFQLSANDNLDLLQVAEDRDN